MTTYPYTYINELVIDFNPDGTFASATQAIATVTAPSVQTVAPPVTILEPALITFLGGFTGYTASLATAESQLTAANAVSEENLTKIFWSQPITPNSGSI